MKRISMSDVEKWIIKGVGIFTYHNAINPFEIVSAQYIENQKRRSLDFGRFKFLYKRIVLSSINDYNAPRRCSSIIRCLIFII